ncbi:TolC family protein [Pedobacter flavus]|uniref:TolC family protein n=1 Tax=Pedobacter flavus TaxID=3113906 RepID=A0ABU7H3T4_9SPHI|nr:TolC family protein [Pedobacter sp. VNH31]MEE1885914.1 TolC family protein [Pedobacter sp. VNH31]
MKISIQSSIKRVLITILIASTTKVAFSQELTLTFKDALKYAVENNTNLRKAKLDIEGGRYKTKEVRAQALPQITGNGTLTDQFIKPQFVLPGDAFGKPGQVVAIESGTTFNASAGVALSQQLFNQQVFTGLQAAKASESFYNLSAELTEEAVILQAATAYYQVLVTRQQIGVIDANISSVSQVEKTVADQYKNGLAKRIDLDRVRVNLTNLRTQRDQLINAVTQQENMLKYIIGMPISTVVSIPNAELKDIESNLAIKLADSVNLAGRVEFKLLLKQKELLNYQKKAYVAEYYPTLGLVGNYSYNGMSNKFNLFNRSSDAFWYDMGSIGLSLKIPIFNGGATRARIKQAEIDLKQLDEDIRDNSLSLNLANENAKIQIKNSLNTLNAQLANVKLAEEVYTSTQNNYKNGLATLTDLLDAETARTSAQNSYSQAILNYKLAEIQLEKSNGTIKSLLN